MARGKNPCKLCQDRAANVKGGICHVCAETEEGKAFLAGQAPPESKPLPDDPTETDLQAMEALWLQQGKAKTVRQRAWVAAYKESQFKFRDRMDRLGAPRTSEPSTESGESATSSTTTWNRVGPCPTCSRAWDRITNDLGHERVVELLGEEWGEKQGAV